MDEHAGHLPDMGHELGRRSFPLPDHDSRADYQDLHGVCLDPVAGSGRVSMLTISKQVHLQHLPSRVIRYAATELFRHFSDAVYPALSPRQDI